MRKLKKIFESYTKLMNTHPTKMQTLQTGMLMGGGDLIAQSSLEKKGLKDVDWRRTAVYAGLGFFFIAPMVSRWYIILERLYGTNGLPTTIKKVATDQIVFAPAMLPIFITLVSLGEGKSLDHVKEELRENYIPILINNYKIWPLVQLANFYFVPLNYRIIVVQLVALLWNTYLSFTIK